MCPDLQRELQVVSIMDSVEELHILFISVFGHRRLLREGAPAKPLKAGEGFGAAISVCLVIPRCWFSSVVTEVERGEIPKIEK